MFKESVQSISGYWFINIENDAFLVLYRFCRLQKNFKFQLLIYNLKPIILSTNKNMLCITLITNGFSHWS